MPSTRVNAQQLGSGGAAAVFAAVDLANGSNYLPHSGRLLVFRNAGAGAVNVTLVTPGTVDGNAVADKVIAVPNGSVPHYVSLGEAIGYRSPTTGEVDFTAAAAIDVAVLQA